MFRLVIIVQLLGASQYHVDIALYATRFECNLAALSALRALPGPPAARHIVLCQIVTRGAGKND